MAPGLVNIRDLLAFPAGSNTTDTVINSIHFNKTALQYWNYTLYSNGTLSNDSNCFLVFDNYQPFMFSNGTFVNTTSCYVPILPLEIRGRLGAVFGSLFGVSIMFTLINLRKHGQLFLREDKRFRIVGRRWQWYWMAMVGACGMISCITGVDVDRDYLQDLGLILQSLFFVLMGQAAMASLWEGVRHWGSWQERQIVDRDPWTLPQDDTRGKIEFYLPLVFYFFAFMSFFMSVPRSWSKIPRQDSAQQSYVAEPAATDGRFKAAGILLFIAWAVIIYYARHALHYYKPHSRGLSSITSAVRYLPLRYPLAILSLGIYLGYIIASFWIFDISIMKYNVAAIWPFCLGYTPCLLFLIFFNIWGFLDQNEDQQLIKQRIERGRAADAILGLTNKPNWWSKARGDHHLDDLTRLRNLVEVDPTEKKGVAPRNREGAGDEEFELQSVHTSATDPFGDSHEARSRSVSRTRVGATVVRDENATARTDSMLSPTRDRWVQRMPSDNSISSALTGQTLGTTSQRQSQQIRSMLDV